MVIIAIAAVAFVVQGYAGQAASVLESTKRRPDYISRMRSVE
jgi:hypothetical protein